MNKYIRALVVIPTGLLKTCCLKLFYPKKFKGFQLAQISPRTEITLDKGCLKIGKGFKMRDGAKIRVRNNAELIIGKNVSVSSNNIIACREKIEIGDNVQLSPNVQIYDHDHDFRAEGGISAGKYKTSPIKIGNNVWIGANTVILRGAIIGDNAVVAAGSVVKGSISSECIFVQKRRGETVKFSGGY